MAEGGKFVWKIQKVKKFGPTANYSTLSEPLPCPPEGMVWKKDEQTRQWKLSLAPREEKENKNTFSRVITGEKKLPDEESFYVEHLVLPTDTFQGLCLAYRISPVRLRQVNGFSGSSLKLAPSKLIIPIPDLQSVLDGTIRIQDIESPEFKRQVLSLEFPTLTPEEVHAYLIICDWDLREALKTVKDDLDWEKSSSSPFAVSSNQITLIAHVAVPVTQTFANASNEVIEIELSSYIQGTKSQNFSSFSLSREVTTRSDVKELSRPLLPRQ
mmetsp:Transcript_23847/g.31642  ORF Transcript_23847/g.31642 Transcript_23847/m.31642 type:complete len:270 (+) Transcript_23847:130-939(+)